MASGLILQVATRCLILRRIPYGDTSWILHGFSREDGRVSLMARGARRPGSPFAGALEPLSLVEALYARKAGREIHTLAQAHLLHGWPTVRKDLSRLSAGLCALEALEFFLTDPLAHEDLFDAAISFLASLEAGHDPALGLARVLSILGQELGLAPRLDSCARCETQMLPVNPCHSPSFGGILCDPCAQGSRLARLDPDVHDALLRLGRGTRPARYDVAVQCGCEAFLYEHLLAHSRRSLRLEARELWNEVRP
ncbi:MAG: hypothetical protein RL318_2962 [Fibrobacterota bacterium]